MPLPPVELKPALACLRDPVRITLLCTLVMLMSTVLVLLTASDNEDQTGARILAVTTALLFGTSLLLRRGEQRTK